MNFTGILGGYVAETAISGMSFDLYWDRAFASITFVDYVPATLKHEGRILQAGTVQQLQESDHKLVRKFMKAEEGT